MKFIFLGFCFFSSHLIYSSMKLGKPNIDSFYTSTIDNLKKKLQTEHSDYKDNLHQKIEDKKREKEKLEHAKEHYTYIKRLQKRHEKSSD